MNERQWEAIDLIIKAWTTHDGPFSHEGRFFHNRMVNIWPRPYQNPHPPVWVSSTSAGGAHAVGRRGFVLATFLSGYKDTPKIFESYRRGWREAGLGTDVPAHRLAYAALVYVGRTEAEGLAGGEKLLWYISGNKAPLHFRLPPGYVPPAVRAQALRGVAVDPNSALRANATVEKAMEAGILFAGTPDQVYRQLATFHDHVGGFGHLLVMGQAGFLEHDETVQGIRTFAREVYPRLKDSFPNTVITGGRASGAGAEKEAIVL
jgi:alkanesulfonate monooxygenase SsuD/methylene tetrahydromethanopterin reductase-like flavin-dependent oxidoreductase (luciferase family)